VHKTISSGDIKDAAKDADRHPSAIKRKIGNYPKGHLSYRGLSISIENAKGSKRSEKDAFGRKNNVKMPAAYGYIRGTVGADNMQVDCYLGKHPESILVWVIDQDKFDLDGTDKGFDEHKVMLCYASAQKAMKDYVKSHYDGLGHERLSAMVQLNYDELKAWLKDGNMKKPISEQGVGHVVARRGENNPFSKMDTVSQSTNVLSYDQVSAARKKKRKKKNTAGPRWLSLSA
jgi:phage terminase large subunit